MRQGRTLHPGPLEGARPCRRLDVTSGLQSCERTNTTCFEPFHLWYFVTQPRDTNTAGHHIICGQEGGAGPDLQDTVNTKYGMLLASFAFVVRATGQRGPAPSVSQQRGWHWLKFEDYRDPPLPTFTERELGTERAR